MGLRSKIEVAMTPHVCHWNPRLPTQLSFLWKLRPSESLIDHKEMKSVSLKREIWNWLEMIYQDLLDPLEPQLEWFWTTLLSQFSQLITLEISFSQLLCQIFKSMSTLKTIKTVLIWPTQEPLKIRPFVLLPTLMKPSPISLMPGLNLFKCSKTNVKTS
jgi:hypothetical protein